MRLKAARQWLAGRRRQPKNKLTPDGSAILSEVLAITDIRQLTPRNKGKELSRWSRRSRRLRRSTLWVVRRVRHIPVTASSSGGARRSGD
jgi:hypothetical protein